MKIKRIDIYGLRLPFNTPFVVAYEQYNDMPTIITKIVTEEGVVGWGEAVPDQHVTGETWHSTFQIIKHELAPLLIGQNPFDINLIHQMMDNKIHGAPAAKASIDIALYDLMGKITDQPLYRLIGGQAHHQLQVPLAIGIDSPDEMASKAMEFAKEGFMHIKIKVGTDPEIDIKRINTVRAAVPNQVQLRVDANQGWDRWGAIQVIKSTRHCSIAWYEQPVKASDLTSLVEIRKATNVRIMADEGVHNSEDLLRLIRLGGVDFINIKLMKTGGIYPALALTKIAEAAGIECQVGSMIESAVATMAGAHLSISQSIIKSNKMSSPFIFDEDVARIHYELDILQFNEKPGLGIDIDEPFLKRKSELLSTVI